MVTVADMMHLDLEFPTIYETQVLDVKVVENNQDLRFLLINKYYLLSSNLVCFLRNV